MAISEEGGNGFYMPVAPANGTGNGFGGDWAWIILLLLLGWGNNGFGGRGGYAGGDVLYPWQNLSNQVNNGFMDQMLHDNINEIRTGVTGISTQLCDGFHGVNAAINAANVANLERSFAAQTATTAGMTGIASQLAQCCCDNRLATNDLKYTIATENCADRQALSDGVRDILANNTAQTQAILDKLCQLELDGYKRENDNLRTQLSDAKFAASQSAQNAFIAQGLNNEVDALYNRLSNCPVPSTPVYGRTPIFTCGGGNGCGCGCAG